MANHVYMQAEVGFCRQHFLPDSLDLFCRGAAAAYAEALSHALNVRVDGKSCHAVAEKKDDAGRFVAYAGKSLQVGFGVCRLHFAHVFQDCSSLPL